MISRPARSPASLGLTLESLKAELGDTGQFTESLPQDDVDRAPPQLKNKHADSQL